jgi:AraC family transcriptional regulator
MEPKIVSKPAFSVVGMEIRGHVEDHQVPQLWQALGPRAGEIGHLAQPGAAYGMTLSFDEASGEFDYVAGFEVDRVEGVPEGMGSWEIPAQTYAVFSCTLPTMGELFKHALGTWLPQSGYRRGTGPEFELYDESFDPQDPDSELAYYIPIE